MHCVQLISVSIEAIFMTEPIPNAVLFGTHSAVVQKGHPLVSFLFHVYVVRLNSFTKRPCGSTEVAFVLVKCGVSVGVHSYGFG